MTKHMLSRSEKGSVIEGLGVVLLALSVFLLVPTSILGSHLQKTANPEPWVSELAWILISASFVSMALVVCLVVLQWWFQ